MTDWHPTLRAADPADAWYGRDKLELQRRAEEAESAFRHMIRRRDRFQRLAAQLDDDDPEALAALWEASELDADSDDETTP